MIRLLLAALALLALSSTAEARRYRPTIADPNCNITMPCIGVGPSARGERFAKAIGFGSAQNIYSQPRPSRKSVSAQIVGHPPGCPSRAFCGCGAAVRVFGAPVRSLWLASNWFKFPRTSPAPGTVAVRRHHVFVLEAHLGGNVWRVYDANSGGRRTRIHARSINGYVIVNPRGGSA
jgi:hypothetical protein